EPEAVDMEHEMTPVSVFFSAQIPIADFQRPLCQQLQSVQRLGGPVLLILCSPPLGQSVPAGGRLVYGVCAYLYPIK
ncbi:hypothetical protein, partial [Pseudoflavonifractor phocaeensis]|uniref:hypothetical protein n=1 Tax=Pseudoflavonifractor phocaeensis TaxID=1870988 RepID=UPI00195A2667